MWGGERVRELYVPSQNLVMGDIHVAMLRDVRLVVIQLRYFVPFSRAVSGLARRANLGPIVTGFYADGEASTLSTHVHSLWHSFMHTVVLCVSLSSPACGEHNCR